MISHALAAIISRLANARVLVVSLGDVGKQLDDVTANAVTSIGLIEHRRDGAPDRLEVAIPGGFDPRGLGRELTTLVGMLGDQYRAIVVDFPAHHACTTAAAIAACDDAVSCPTRTAARQALRARRTVVCCVS
jgi:cellulose biosynthesis protein BcsQ